MPKTYGTPINSTASAPAAHRNRVGEADAATRRRNLDARLAERQAPPARAKRQPATSSSDATGSSPNAYRLLRDRGRQIDKEVDKQN